MKITLIGDAKIRAIPIQECGDSMIDLAKDFPTLQFDQKRKNVQKKSETISMARKKIGEMLVSAQNQLPAGIQLLIKECHRPLWLQSEFFENYSHQLRKIHPEWNQEQINIECSKFIAPVDIAPHSTGGAVDLTLMDQNGNWLDMATEFNADPMSTEYATYTDAPGASPEAKRNREILKSVMIHAGFVNYPTEWWHWSYGDQYWAYVTGQPHAVFSSQEDHTDC